MHFIISRIFAILMVPLSLLIIIQEIGLFTLNMPVDKILVGAILMLALEAITAIGVIINYKALSMTNIIAIIAFAIPAVIYLGQLYLGFPVLSYIPLILGVTMFGETIYALGI
jgi:hypothetical protein